MIELIFKILILLGILSLTSGLYAIERYAKLVDRLTNDRAKAVSHFDFVNSGVIGFLMIPIGIFTIAAGGFCYIFG